MGLNFQPPEWLLQEYMNRKSPVQQASEGIQGALGQYMQIQNQQQTQQLAQEDRDIKLAQLNNEGGSNGMETLNAIRKARGLPPLTMPTAQAPAQSPVQAPSMAPEQPEANFSSISGDQQNVTPQGSPIISHLQSIGHPMGQLPGMTPPPMAKQPAPVMGSDPAIQEFLQLGAKGYQAKYGSTGMKKVKEALDIEKGLQDKNANSGGPKTLEAILADRVRNGEMTLDQAIQKQAEAAGLKTTGTETAKNTVKVSAEKPSARASLTNTQRELDNMIAQAEAIKNDPDLGYATGWAGTVAPKIPSTGARRVSANIETLKAKTLLNVLASLKELSSSGASGFGQLSNIEGENIRNSIASLDTKQSSQDFKNNLNKIIQEIKSKKSTLETKFNETYGNSSGQENVQTQNTAPETKVVNGQTFVKQNGQWYHQ